MSVLKATHLFVVLVSADFFRCEAFSSLPIFPSTVSISQSRCLLEFNARLRGFSPRSTGRRAGFVSSTRMVTEDQRCVHAFSRECTVLVAGASRGLGLEFVRQLLAKGSYVLATHRGQQPPKELSDLFASSSGRLQLIQCDVANSESIRSAVESMKGR